MSQQNPTIIVGHLDDSELTKSIDNLVSYVDKKIRSMATNFDDGLKRMKESLKNLGDIKVDSGGVSDAGSSRRTKRNSEEAKSVRETAVAYDQLATAVQNATKPKSAEQSFYAFIQNYRENAAKLASELKTMPSASLDRQMAEYQRFEKEINAVQRKIQELRQQLNDIGGKPSTSRFEVKAITDEINRLQTLIRQLTSEQISSTRRIAEEDNVAMVQKRALYERTVQLVRELTTEQTNSTIATQRQNAEQEQLTRKIQRQAEIIRQRIQENGKGMATWGTTVIYDPNDARNAKMKRAQLSIEEQIVQAHQQQVAITQERIAAEQRENKTKQETVASTQAQAQAEQQVTQAQQQRNVGQSAKRTFQTYEDFSQALAHVLGLQQQEIRLADSETSSYSRLQQTLRTLQAAYNQLSSSERNSDNGKTLVASMHEVQRAIQKIQQQSARPVNLMAAMGLSEKTLDDIVYKMQMLSRYRNGIDFTNPNSRNEIQRVNSELERLKSTQDKLIGQNARYAHSNELLGRSFDYIKNRIAFVLTVGTITQFTKSIYEIRGQYELLERSIGILFDSMQQGSRIFAELNAMAIKSPFTTLELGAAAKQLSAYDIAAKDVVDTTKRLADMAAAVGVPIERLTYALGQIKAYGYLNARDARMFANAGIPLVQNLADMYTKLEGRLVSVGDIYDRIKKKAISFEDVLKVVNEMTDEGGKFFNFQEKAADTLKVKLANLTLAYNNMLNEIGKSNQTLLTAPLVGLKKVYENWRNINNIIKSLIISFGLLKAAQILYIAYTSKVSLATAAADVASKRLVGTLYAMKGAFVTLASNPFTWITAVLASLGYMYIQMRDLDEATEQFNKSISQNAQENIDSINKFFNEYKKDIDTINSLNTADQQKMWERIREEIEKTSKNAQQYIDILEKINNVSSRVRFASDYLSQIQQIQHEAQRLADHGAFSVGGGFGNDALATDLQDYERTMNSVLKRYGSLEKAQQDFSESLVTWSSGQYAVKYYNEALKEAEKELRGFVGSLDDVDLGKVLGEGTSDEQLANLREFANIVRDNFLTTEKGQKISSEGRALLNKQLDNWIAKNGVQNRLLTEENAQIEANRTAWETFFSQLNKKEKETVDYLVETNQIGSDEFKKIWDNAAKKMKDSAITSYHAIQEQIATLRNTPDIVINVVYKQNKEQLDEQQQQFKETFLTPVGKGVLPAENYLKQVKELTTKYGRFQKKENENNVEWEKRLGETYRNNESSLKSLNAQLKNSANLSDVDRKAKEGERDALIAENKVLDEIKTKQNFNYEKDKKDKKTRTKQSDEIAKAIKNEISLVKELQGAYDTLTKKGDSHANAIAKIQDLYGKTIDLLNKDMDKFGLPRLDLSIIKGNNHNEVLAFFEKLRDVLESKGLSNLERMEAVEGVVKEFRLKADTYNLDMITKGLNNELGKLKDEYELAVELDADPELGGIFADMFDLNVDQLPHSINEYAERVTVELNKALKERGDNIQLPTIYLTKDDIDAFRKMSEGGKLNTKSFEEIQKAYQDFVSLRKKAATDVSKIASDYIREYGDLSAQIQQIEIEKNDALMKLNEIYNTDALRQTQRYLDAKFAIEDGAKRKQAKATFDALKKEADYERFFTAIDTLTKKDALSIKNKIKKGIIDAFKDGGLTISQFRKEIKALEEQFDKLSQPTSNWISYLNGGFDKLIQKAKETGQEIETIGEKISITGKVDEKDKNYLQSLGNIFSNGKGGNTDFSSLMSHFGKDMKGLGSNISKAGQGMQAGASGFAGAVTIVDAIIRNVHQTVQAIGSVIDELDSVRNEDNKISNAYWEGFKKFDNYAMSGWENLKSGNVAGAIADTTNSIISIFNTFSNAKNERINKEIKESERAVKRLELAYIDLEHAVNEAYGMATIGANMAAKANKELQLVELKRQLALERSRDSKHRDEDRIIDLQKQIKELEYEIEDAVDNIVNDLLGISSVGDAMENMMDAFIEALRSGEDAMATFDENVDEMIANMVKKMYVTKILQPWFEEQWDKIQEQINQRAGDIPEKIAKMQSKTSIAKSADTTDNNSLVEALRALGMSDEQIHLLNWYNEFGQYDRGEGRNARLKAAYEKMLKEAEQKEAELQKELTNATMPTMDDIRRYAELVRSGEPILSENMKGIENFLRELGLMKDDANKNLSALQQGIQSVSEETAGALEAYMNSVSQQVYLHSDLLTQIRDIMVGWNFDVQLGALSQILLQLQSSYQVQMSIQNILIGWSNPSGGAVKVELIS